MQPEPEFLIRGNEYSISDTSDRGIKHLIFIGCLSFISVVLMRCRSEGFTAVKREFEDKRAVHISDRHPLLGHIRVSGASLPCV